MYAVWTERVLDNPLDTYTEEEISTTKRLRANEEVMRQESRYAGPRPLGKGWKDFPWGISTIAGNCYIF